MKIKMKTCMAGPQGIAYPEEEMEIEDERGMELIKGGYAVALQHIKKPPKIEEPPKNEEPPETEQPSENEEPPETEQPSENGEPPKKDGEKNENKSNKPTRKGAGKSGGSKDKTKA